MRLGGSLEVPSYGVKLFGMCRYDAEVSAMKVGRQGPWKDDV